MHKKVLRTFETERNIQLTNSLQRRLEDTHDG